MKLWVDNVRPASLDYHWARSVDDAKFAIRIREQICATLLPNSKIIEVIDIGHNAGDYESEGGHYIKLLEWLEETGRNYPIHIHSDNQINLLWMREIIERNGWKEV